MYFFTSPSKYGYVEISSMSAPHTRRYDHHSSSHEIISKNLSYLNNKSTNTPTNIRIYKNAII